MTLPVRSSLFVLLLAPTACIAPVTIGGNPADTEDGGDSETNPADSGDAGDSATDSGGPPLACPDSPPDFTCSTPHDCSFGGCGGPTGDFDADGCLRVRCSDDTDCPGERVCVRVGDWGGGLPSSTFCEDFEGACSCGGTADGSEEVRVCVPPEEVPEFDPVACADLGSGEAFTWVSSPAAVGVSDCAVLAVGATVELDCTGATMGTVELELSLPGPNPLEEGDEIELEYVVADMGGYVEQWLALRRGAFPNVRVLAAMASDLVPPGEGIEWWSEGAFGLSASPEVVCPITACAGEPELGVRPEAIRAEQGGVFTDFGPGDAGPIPGKYGEVSPSIAVQQAYERGCDPNGPYGWASLTVVWDPI